MDKFTVVVTTDFYPREASYEVIAEDEDDAKEQARQLAEEDCFMYNADTFCHTADVMKRE